MAAPLRRLATAAAPLRAPLAADARASVVLRGAAPAKKEGGSGKKAGTRPDDTKYRQMLNVLYPKDPRPPKPPKPDAEELERRAVVAKLWSRYAVRQEHVQNKEIHNFIAARREARKALQEAYPEAVTAADAKDAVERTKPFPIDRRMPTDTPPLASSSVQ